jgi:hypothetical protein
MGGKWPAPYPAPWLIQTVQLIHPTQSTHFIAGFVWPFSYFKHPLAIPPGRNRPVHRWMSGTVTYCDIVQVQLGLT